MQKKEQKYYKKDQIGDKMEVIDRIDEESVRKISKIKGEPKWMENFRVKSYKKFAELKNPNFGPQLSIDFNLINYYKKYKTVKLYGEEVLTVSTGTEICS